MKHVEMKASTLRMLLPGLAGGSPPWTPQSVRLARLAQAQGVAVAPKAVPKIIVGRMAKGGVGKTTVIGNLGSALAMMGHKVLLVDGDPQASLTGLMGVDWTKEGLVHIGHLMRRCHQRQPVNLEEAVEPVYADGHLDLIPADITLVEADV